MKLCIIYRCSVETKTAEVINTALHGKDMIHIIWNTSPGHAGQRIQWQSDAKCKELKKKKINKIKK